MNNRAIGGDHPNFLQIGQPPTAGFIMGVTDIITGRRALATDSTNTGHDSSPQKNQ